MATDGYFTVKAKTILSSLEIGARIPESDFSTLCSDGTFVQLEYHEADDKDRVPYDVKPGVYSITKIGMSLGLEKTSFVTDVILEDFIETNEIDTKIDCFFKRLHIYKELGFEVPKRGMLLYGPPGGGKTSKITKTCERYLKDGKTTVVTWATDRYDPYDVKEFIKTFNYIGVDKLIFIAEDIGGVEMENARVKSDSSLLSLLDNQEKTFKIPVMIIGTTNHPEMFLANLTNRPNRFDDKIKVGFPRAEARIGLLNFFAKDKLELDEGCLDLMASDKCKEFTPAHIREVIIRSMIYDKKPFDTITEMLKEIAHYKTAFADKAKGKMGMGSWDDSD